MSSPLRRPAPSLRRLAEAVPLLPRGLVTVALFSGLSSLLALVPAIFSIQVYDRVLSSRSGATLLLLLGITLFLVVIWVVLDAARQRILLLLAAALDEGLAPTAGRVLMAGHHGAAKDLATVRHALGGTAMVALFDAPWLPVILLALGLLHPVLGALATVGVAGALALMLLQDSRQRQDSHIVATLAASQAQSTDELPRQAETWRAHNALPNLLARWGSAREGWLRRQTRLLADAVTYSALLRGLKQALQSALLALGAWLVIGGELTPGVMIGATLLFGRLLGPLETLQHGWRPLREAWPAALRLAALLPDPATGDALDGAHPPPEAGVPRLGVQGLGFGWPGSPRPLLSGVHLTVAPGECIAVVGPAASGKTSLARLLLGLADPVLGHVLVDGRTWRQREAAGDAPRRGWWGADTPVWDGTIAEHIACGAQGDSQRIAEAAAGAGLTVWIETLPAGHDSRLGRGGIAPSLHQQRGLALARLLYARPQVVVFDEPGVLTDGDAARCTREAIDRLRATGATVLVLTGRQSWARLAPRWLVLRGGQLVADGPAADVARQIGLGSEATP